MVTAASTSAAIQTHARTAVRANHTHQTSRVPVQSATTVLCVSIHVRWGGMVKTVSTGVTAASMARAVASRGTARVNRGTMGVHVVKCARGGTLGMNVNRGASARTMGIVIT